MDRIDTTARSMAFLVPMQARDGGLSEFYRTFKDHGYDACIPSDYYGLRGKGDDKVLRYLKALFANAEKFEKAESIRAQFVMDVEGFRLNTNFDCRKLCEHSKFVSGFHVRDEPDAHTTGVYNVFRATPDEIDKMLEGTLAQMYGKPLYMTFENQAGRVVNRRWSYRLNNDALYLKYMDAVNKWGLKKNVFGIDYYMFNRSKTPPKSQVSQYVMEKYFSNYARGYTFAWNETVMQGLGYMKRYRPRPASPNELMAMQWLFWVAGQTHIQGDFNYVFEHLWRGKTGHNPFGTDLPEYAEHKKVIRANNAKLRELSEYLDGPAIHLSAVGEGSTMVKASGRVAAGSAIIMVVDPRTDEQRGRKRTAVVGHTILAGRALVTQLAHNCTKPTEFDENGNVLLDMDPGGVWIGEFAL